MKNTVAILDAGAQYGKVIDRRVRELGVRTEILPLDADTAKLKQYDALIISGGPESVYGPKAPEYNPEIFDLDLPILGICYGQQLINYIHGGTVEKKSVREDGQFEIKVETDSPLFKDMDANQQVLLTHGDSVDKIPEGFRVIAQSGEIIAGIENRAKKLYAVQFHPEVDLTTNGKQILSNFLFEIAGLKADYTIEDREAKAIEMLKNTIGNNKALILLSGGVDSTVTAALLAKAIPQEQIYAIHIDHGFMRKDESQQVIKSLESLGLDIKLVEAGETFAKATTEIEGKETLPLNQNISPEEKRKIIGDTFIRVAEQAIADFNLDPDETFLVQGTLRPDLIESASSLASSKAETIKTHHNDTALVRQLRDKGRVVEPLSEYHKDEVRQLGQNLGLDTNLVWRQPFPGPGLAIRVICAKQPYLDNYDQVYQALQEFATDNIKVTLLPIKTVGVQGDGRTYSYCAALTTKSSPDWQQLRFLALEIPKTIHQVNRVVYVFGESFDQPIKEITPTLLEPAVLSQLRDADSIVNQTIRDFDLVQSLTQVPVVSTPVSFGRDSMRSIVIRTFITNDFMTGVPAIPGQQMPVQALDQMVAQIQEQVIGVARVMYDLTAKPPGTTEWE